MKINVSLDGRPWTIAVGPGGRPGDVAVEVKGKRRVVSPAWIDNDTLSLIDGGTVHLVLISGRGTGELRVQVGGQTFDAVVSRSGLAPLSRSESGTEASSLPEHAVRAPMPGRVVRLLVAVGDRVREGQGVAVVEAMKMENEVRTSRQCAVKKIVVEAGSAVEAGATLMVIGS
jgi:biotin carboxyl carrier protein